MKTVVLVIMLLLLVAMAADDVKSALVIAIIPLGLVGASYLLAHRLTVWALGGLGVFALLCLMSIYGRPRQHKPCDCAHCAQLHSAKCLGKYDCDGEYYVSE